jgi:hypothetical protein
LTQYLTEALQQNQKNNRHTVDFLRENLLLTADKTFADWFMSVDNFMAGTYTHRKLIHLRYAE